MKLIILQILVFLQLSQVKGQLTCEDKTRNCQTLVNGALVTYPTYSHLRTKELIELQGYRVTEHNVTTDDDYILTMYRIPPTNDNVSAAPVFLMHGLFASSAPWVLGQTPKTCLAFILADAGYDVWIGNARGTSYSLGHRRLPSNSSTDLRYWNFSSYEMGKYDVPANINYVLNATSQPSLYWIGHSLGAQQFFIAMTLHPELNSKVRTMFALAPAAYPGNTTNLFLRGLAPFYAPYFAERVENVLAQGRFVPTEAQQAVGGLIEYCAISAINCALCSNLYFLVFGFSPCQTNFTLLPAALAHAIDSSSAKTFSHFSQAVLTGSFSQYDYGLMENMKRYGSSTPPNYNWRNVNVPVLLFWGNNDNIIVPQDIAKTATNLGRNVKENIRVQYDQWNHNDFIFGIDAYLRVYPKILDVLNNQRYG